METSNPGPGGSENDVGTPDEWGLLLRRSVFFWLAPPRSARIAHCVRARVQANKSFHYAVAVGTTPQAWAATLCRSISGLGARAVGTTPQAQLKHCWGNGRLHPKIMGRHGARHSQGTAFLHRWPSCVAWRWLPVPVANAHAPCPHLLESSCQSVGQASPHASHPGRVKTGRPKKT